LINDKSITIFSQKKLMKIGGSYAVTIPLEWIKSMQYKKRLPKNLKDVEFDVTAKGEKVTISIPEKVDISISE